MSLLTIKQLGLHHIGPISLELAPGQCLSLAGPSGSGKTLLLRAIADLEPHCGEIYLDGQPCHSLRAHRWRQQVGLLPAESQWWRERVGDHFAHGQDVIHLEALGFDQAVLGWDVARCSTGERQRLALLRLLQNRPRVLLLDEPTASLDSQNVACVEQLIARLRQEWQLAVIWVSHDAEQMARVATDHLHFRSDGQLREGMAPW